MRNNLFVFDTNILISAFLFKSLNPRKAIDIAIERGKIFSSLETYKELCEVFLHPKFDKYLSKKSRLLILKDLKKLSDFREPSESIAACRDPKDNKFLELAVSANASCIITGDKDLLDLHPFRGISVLNAADFISKFNS